LFKKFKSIYIKNNYNPSDKSLKTLLKHSLKEYHENGKCQGYGEAYKNPEFNNQIKDLFENYF